MKLHKLNTIKILIKYEWIHERKRCVGHWNERMKLSTMATIETGKNKLH
jgi:hypothetical protein